MVQPRKNYTKLFIIRVYALFWACILLTGALGLLFGEKTPMQLLVTFCSWTPTMVFLIMFKKLVPETTRKEFIKKLFQTKINWGLFLSITVIQFLLVFIMFLTRVFDQYYTTLLDQMQDLYHRKRTHLPDEIRRKKEEALHSGQRAATLH